MSHGRNEVSHSSNEGRSFLQSVFSASFGGMIGALAAYPFEGLKKSVQAGLLETKTVSNNAPKASSFLNGLRLFMNPKELYRGTGAFATSLVPTTIIQMSAKRYFDQQPMSENTRFATDLLSASSGSIASTAAEKIILTQRIYKIGPAAAIKHVVSKQGMFGLWNGISAIGTREMIFGTCMLRYSADAYDQYGFPGTLTLGVTGAALSHAPDCIATRLQVMSLVDAQQVTEQRKPKVRDAVKAIYQESGVRGFTKGLGWRCLLFTTAMTVIPATSDAIGEKLDLLQSPKPEM